MSSIQESCIVSLYIQYTDTSVKDNGLNVD